MDTLLPSNSKPSPRPRSLSAVFSGDGNKESASHQGKGGKGGLRSPPGPKPPLPPRPNYKFKQRPRTASCPGKRPTLEKSQTSTPQQDQAEANVQVREQPKMRGATSSSSVQTRPLSVCSTQNVFIAIDLGTTYSGIAFAIGSTSDRFYGGEQVPTAVLLDKHGELKAFGKSARQEYYDIEDEEVEDWFLFDRFKMLLKNDKDVQLSTLEIPAANKKFMSAKTVFTRCLEHFYNQAKTEVPRSTGVPWNDEEVKWVLTVPAIWGDRAKHFMRTVAMEAGLVTMLESENLVIALEPEAAALCCRSDLQEVWQVLDKPETMRYIVVDCGGGTVDITVDDLTMSTSEINEIHRPTGGAWGGTEVDKNIADLLRRAMGNTQVDSTTWLHFSREGIEQGKKLDPDSHLARITVTSELVGQLQEAGFDLSKSINLPEGVSWRRKASQFVVDRALVEQCYAGPIKSIIDHLHELKPTVDPVHSILVVGGFAESSLLMKQLEEAFTSDRCRVVRPINANLAVVKGAVMYAQNPDIVQQRVAQWSYGLEDSVPFIESEHDSKHRYSQDGQTLCAHVFVPFVKEGDKMNIFGKKVIEMSPVSKEQDHMSIKLYRSPHRNVKYTDEVDCELLLKLDIKMPRVEKGLDRVVKVTIDVSRTSLHLSAVDTSSGQQADLKYNESE